MFDRHEIGETVVLVNIAVNQKIDEDKKLEFHNLVEATGATVEASIDARISTPNSKFFIGTGKIDEIASICKMHKAGLVAFDIKLSPSQERNLEKILECRVIDRTGVILDIFSQRARTYEGKLQVELAQLHHISTRLIRGWTHLERQKGGIGLRGPGETQLETDRRLLQVRINYIEARLKKVSKQRSENRKMRQKNELHTVSLVGYTNAGKSTLFNYLTHANVFAEDQLFATLDPTLRKVQLPSKGSIFLADTVGFIQDLPHDLIAAFKATLLEVNDASLLLHVIDVSEENHEKTRREVNKVLKSIEAQDQKQLLVYNKIDALDFEQLPRIEYNEEEMPESVWVSAANGLGTDLLLQAIEERLSENLRVKLELEIDLKGFALRSKIFEHALVLSERIEDVISLQIDIDKVTWMQLTKEFSNYILYQKTIE